MIPVATGLSYGHANQALHAEIAVQRALAKTTLSQASSVLLFLTPECAREPKASIRSAARVAGCTQIVGCTGVGVLTEEEWVMDSPAAAAMVFGSEIHLASGPGYPLSLCFATGDHLSLDVLNSAPMFGMTTADTVDGVDFKVWSSSRIAEQGHVEVVIDGTIPAVGLSHSILELGPPLRVSQARQHELVSLDGISALASLTECVQRYRTDRIGLTEDQLFFGILEEDRDDSDPVPFRLGHILSTDIARQTVTLSSPVLPGERLFWAILDPEAAERSTSTLIDSLHRKLRMDPSFGLLFPSVQRGPAFFGDRDRDVDLLASRLPGLPFAGYYGRDQIAPADGVNRICQYAAALGLFAVPASK